VIPFGELRLRKAESVPKITAVEGATALNRSELRRYIARISDRWRLHAAHLGGARVADEQGAPSQRERGPEYIVILVSDGFHTIPWLERVYVAASLWDAMEMGDRADVHCYTEAEFARKCVSLPSVRNAVWRGIDLLNDPR